MSHDLVRNPPDLSVGRFKKLNREQRIGYELAVSRIEGLAKKWRRQGGWQGLEPACSKSLRQRYQHARTLASELRSWPED